MTLNTLLNAIEEANRPPTAPIQRDGATLTLSNGKLRPHWTLTDFTNPFQNQKELYCQLIQVHKLLIRFRSGLDRSFGRVHANFGNNNGKSLSTNGSFTLLYTFI